MELYYCLLVLWNKIYAGDNKGRLGTSYSVKSRRVKWHDGAKSSATYTKRIVSIPTVLRPLYSSAWDAGMLGGLRGQQGKVTRKLWWNRHWMQKVKAELPHLHLSINNLSGLLMGVWISNKNTLGKIWQSISGGSHCLSSMSVKCQVLMILTPPQQKKWTPS